MIDLSSFKDYMADPSVLKEEHIKDFNDKTKNIPYRIEDSCFDDKYTTIVFDTGWITFHIEDIVCYIMAYYRDKKSSGVKKDEIWSAFKNTLKENGCEKITMYTKINPKMWEKRYGFMINRYEMEVKI